MAGAGLAGTLVVWALLSRGHRVKWWAPNPGQGASWAAAGLVNPLMGPNLARVWRAHTQLWATHAALARSQGFEAWGWQGVLRPFADAKQAAKFCGRLRAPAYLALVQQVLAPTDCPTHGGVIAQGGWVDLPTWLAHLQQALSQHPALTLYQTALPAPACSPKGRGWLADGHHLDALIWAPGKAAAQHPHYPGPPLNALKGQALHLQAPGHGLERPLATKVGYVVPIGQDALVVGATHERGLQDDNPTPQGLATLLNKAAQLLPHQAWSPSHVLEHRAGVRMTTADRLPVVGPHPTLAGLWWLGGLGSRGLLFAPYWAQRLVEALEGTRALPPQVLPGRPAPLHQA